MTLDRGAAALAFVMGIAFAVFGGYSYWYLFVGVMALFLVLSALVTSVGMIYKKHIGTYQPTRGIRNVLANGLVPLAMAALYFAASSVNKPFFAELALVGFIASVAAITADKLASEVGVLGGMPHMIFTFKKVRKGTSGGLTPLGVLSSALGAFVIALMSVFAAAQITTLSIAGAVAIITVAGTIGGLVDSVMGYYEERGVGNKYTSNFICSVAGALLAMLLFLII